MKERKRKRKKRWCQSEREQQLLWESTFPLEAIIWRCYHCPTSPPSSRDSQGDFAVLDASMMSCAIWAPSSHVIGRQHVSAEVKKMHLFCCHGFSRLLNLLALPCVCILTGLHSSENALPLMTVFILNYILGRLAGWGKKVTQTH